MCFQPLSLTVRAWEDKASVGPHLCLALQSAGEDTNLTYPTPHFQDSNAPMTMASATKLTPDSTAPGCSR